MPNHRRNNKNPHIHHFIVVAKWLHSIKVFLAQECFVFKKVLCCVYTCRFDNQIPNGKLVKKYFHVVKLAKYFVCKEERKLTSYCKQEI